jgi:nucleoid-associated protein YgaU
VEMSPPLRWLATIAILAIVVLIAGALLIDTVSDTVQLSTGASEESTQGVGAVSEQAAAPASEPASGDDGFPQNYTVQEGDTGTKISERFYNSDDGWSRIAEANDIDPSAPLRVGEELEIPAPE